MYTYLFKINNFDLSNIISLCWFILIIILVIFVKKKMKIKYFKRYYKIISNRDELDKITDTEWQNLLVSVKDNISKKVECYNYCNYYCNPDFDIHGEPILTKENSRNYKGKNKPIYGKDIFEYDFPILIPNGGKLVIETNIPRIIELIRK